MFSKFHSYSRLGLRNAIQRVIDFVVMIVISPLLLIEGLYIRKIVLRLPEPEGVRTGQLGNALGPELRVLVLGDSAAAGVGVSSLQQSLTGQIAEHLATTFNLTWKLIARSGATTSSTLSHLKKIDAESFDVVVISLGVNDVTSILSCRTWLNQQAELFDVLTNKFNAKSVFATALPPIHRFPLLPQPLRWFLGQKAFTFDNALQCLLRNRPGCWHVPIVVPSAENHMAADGFHPGPAMYALWGQEMAKLILGQHYFSND